MTFTYKNSKKSPRISIIVTARNDDYGGNLLNRVGTFVRTLITLTNRYATAFELILVEYNPLPEKHFLHELLPIRDNYSLNVRAIIVPPSFHYRLPNSNRIPFFELMAKNIGLRRAQGEYLIAMNPDIILDEKTVAFLASDKLEMTAFYRIDRRDVSIPVFPETMPIERVIRLCKKNTEKIRIANDALFGSYSEWLRATWRSRSKNTAFHCPLFNAFFRRKAARHIHDHAAGDFTMTHRDNWDTVGGYDQRPSTSYLDGYLLHVLYCSGIHQVVLPTNMFHIRHRGDRAGRPEVDAKQYQIDAANMQRTKISYKQRDPHWGFPDEHFEEYEYISRTSI